MTDNNTNNTSNSEYSSCITKNNLDVAYAFTY